jgi:hypothetical protein
MSRIGRKLSPETIDKIRKACTGHHRGLGRILTPAHREAIRKGKLGIRHTPETLATLRAIAEKRRNVPLAPDTVAKMRAQKSRMLVCPYCGTSGKAGGMQRHHFEHCKQKPQPESSTVALQNDAVVNAS